MTLCFVRKRSLGVVFSEVESGRLVGEGHFSVFTMMESAAGSTDDSRCFNVSIVVWKRLSFISVLGGIIDLYDVFYWHKVLTSHITLVRLAQVDALPYGCKAGILPSCHSVTSSFGGGGGFFSSSSFCDKSMSRDEGKWPLGRLLALAERALTRQQGDNTSHIYSFIYIFLAAYSEFLERHF